LFFEFLNLLNFSDDDDGKSLHFPFYFSSLFQEYFSSLTINNNFFIHRDYNKYANKILGKENNFIFRGTPGVGKSLFCFYLTVRILQKDENEKVYFISV
jgi:DNA replication protein DnaC